ncbi:hypothetical protein MOSE0_B02894 [Monosporozyma servazzii]
MKLSLCENMSKKRGLYVKHHCHKEWSFLEMKLKSMGFNKFIGSGYTQLFIHFKNQTCSYSFIIFLLYFSWDLGIGILNESYWNSFQVKFPVLILCNRYQHNQTKNKCNNNGLFKEIPPKYIQYSYTVRNSNLRRL